ncbi:tat pathway signal sequence [Colletotrichum scovillei]|uniref:Tat pathway signal sequence n=1 Tax=Colletotrichum scovillei TaxID=1209932 RepID=A0A9P7UHH2_9PEZI|nr:tat pathway signal sequence [Colletotrichum scovillei]KAG7075404.1 tat pathway signal sequence [Colletotrichum scovillei]KAG7082291.1 tat pathway signal sequence [Colletotrichum scovillei]
MPRIKMEGVKAEPPNVNLHELPRVPDTVLQQAAGSSNPSASTAVPSLATAQPNASLPHIKPEPGSAAVVKEEQADPVLNPASPTNEGLTSVEEPEQSTAQDEVPDFLEQWTTETSPEILEQGVKIGLEVLESLKVPLSLTASLPGTQAMTWVRAIEDLKARSRPSKTIVGVVGNTGAGKSSVINALLDEERLLPTNCLRACTASPTEISYNDSENPEELYRSEIEFISVEDWKKELKILFTDLLDDSGNISRECSNEDSEAGIAYAKIKSVYPNKTKEMIAQSDPDRLVNEPAVARVLGSVKKLRATTAKDLYASMQRYVDSKEKNPHKKDVPMEFWPLIKVVRIFTKANALSTGAVIVDLPGVQDSNAARAAVAQNYMKACTGLWIVAPINRAVDDKTAKSLLGDSFKRQLKYDGIYSAVTFICSKTDDISVTEAAESLDIESDISASWSKIEKLRGELRELKRKLNDAREEKSDLVDGLEQIDTLWDKWDDLASKYADGKTVFAPSESKKRKRGATTSKSRKRKSSYSSSSESDDSDYNSDSDKENDPDSQNRQPLTEDKIHEKLADLKNQKKEIRQRRKEVDAALSNMRQEIKSIQAEEERLLGAAKAVCIQGRNNYSKGAIQRDFAMGIKELDQEAAIEEDEETFNPDEDIRDYDEVARNLPVFCVSSRAYQKMRGRLQKDDFNNDGFRDVNETEVPQLQQHAKKLTEGGRAAGGRRFLTELSQLLNSMKMWAANDGSRSHLSQRELQSEGTRVRMQLATLDNDFAKAVDNCIVSVKDALSESIYDYFDLSIPMAASAAGPTASGWGAHRSEGGMFWATYKATCRRSGVYSGASGPRDFNAELLEPISRQLASEGFHGSVIARSQELGADYNGINMLSTQLRAHTARLREIPGTLRTVVQELQREASRGFHPVVQREMQPAYDICVAESGPGSYARMKNHMVSHVETSSATMFRYSTDSVKEQLEALCRRLQDELTTQVQDIYSLLARDYLHVLIGVDKDPKPTGLSRAERLLRAEMYHKLEQTAKRFARPSQDAGADSANTPGVGESDDPFADSAIADVDDLLLAQLCGGTVEGVGAQEAVKSEPSV